MYATEVNYSMITIKNEGYWFTACLGGYTKELSHYHIWYKSFVVDFDDVMILQTWNLNELLIWMATCIL